MVGSCFFKRPASGLQIWMDERLRQLGTVLTFKGIAEHTAKCEKGSAELPAHSCVHRVCFQHVLMTAGDLHNESSQESFLDFGGVGRRRRGEVVWW